ncbi:MAG: hypothetical protein HKO62_13040 [Gammaproteobacteria bacterium]|nr:hypothetical protein [Gammaproteobacteria bacterium]
MSKYLAPGHERIDVIASERGLWHDLRDPGLVDQLPANVYVSRAGGPQLRDLRAGLERLAIALPAASGIVQTLKWRLGQLYPDPIAAWALLALLRALWLVARYRHTILITSGPPHLPHWVGLRLKQLFPRLRWIADFRDPWMHAGTGLDAGSWQNRWQQRLEARVLARADAVVDVSPAWLADHRRRHPELPAERFLLINNGHDIETAPELAANSETANCWLHYNGTLQGRNESPVLFEAMRECFDSGALPGDGLRVTFTGLPDELGADVTRLKLTDCVEDLGYLSHGESVRTCCHADVLLIIINTADAYTNGMIPAKTYEYMALGQPILAVVPADSDVRAILKDYPGAYFATPDDPSGTAATLRRIIADKADGQLSKAVHRDRRRALAEPYRRANQAGHFTTLIERWAAS